MIAMSTHVDKIRLIWRILYKVEIFAIVHCKSYKYIYIYWCAFDKDETEG